MRYSIFILLIWFVACKKEEGARSLAVSRCSSCHLFPEPELLRKKDWQDVLDVMGIYLGYDDAGLLNQAASAQELMERRAMFDERLLPESPSISREDWQRIRSFFQENSPEEFAAAPQTMPDLDGFRRIIPAEARPESLFFLVRAHGERIYAADARSETLHLFSNSGKAIRSDPLPGLAVDMQFLPEEFSITLLGSWRTENTREGKILIARQRDGQLFLRPVLENLYRVPSSQFVDLNDDGRPEILTAQFGHQLGHLSYFENRSPEGQKEDWEETTLLSLPGTVKARAVDPGDGSLAIVALVAQAREGLYVFRQGWRGWQKEVVARQPPVWGYTDFQTADFDGDGQLDILTVNGDNAEIQSVPLKPYHGLRLYRNLNGKFIEAAFLPLAGAYRAAVADFDGDGDVDIAAIAFFGDFSQAKPANAVIFLNESQRGRLQFNGYRLPGTECGRWVSVEARDINGDGRVDLMLGGADVPGMPGRGLAAWRQRCSIQSLLLLRNEGFVVRD